ncbi:MAG TPA: SPOR domain-containing protein, partial [Thermoanaerobaculia bacterium]|nr:SPOR domain-containing protein [Thermoanaerobaculia bacterium]
LRGGPRQVVKLSRPPGEEAAGAEALPPPPENWESWRDGARACGLGFSDLERIAKVVRSAGRPAVEVGPGADRPAALGLRQRLAAGGERVVVIPTAKKGKPACSVWIGPLASPQVAQEMAQRVSAAYGVDARAGYLPDVEKLGE